MTVEVALNVASSSFPNNNYLDFINGESIVNYFIVYMLTDNQELNHPKVCLNLLAYAKYKGSKLTIKAP